MRSVLFAAVKLGKFLQKGILFHLKVWASEVIFTAQNNQLFAASGVGIGQCTGCSVACESARFWRTARA